MQDINVCTLQYTQDIGAFSVLTLGWAMRRASGL